MTNPPGELRARLRDATAPAHQRLEAALDLLAEPCERSRFVEVLERFRGFHAAWEPALALALPDDAALLVDRRKLALIDVDLLALGRPRERIEALPEPAFAAALCRMPASALGSLYVLEGSTLGGKFISRRLREIAGSWLPEAGLRYFDPYGDASGSRWRETLARLEAAPTAQWPGIEAGAIATFEGLQGWLATREAAAA
jgi:heme oxygenase (biliverdin-IX-beta and delta-forming)